MENRGIKLSGAGTNLVNDSYTIVNPASLTTDRVWQNVSKSVKIYWLSSISRWVIGSYADTAVYYTHATEVADPWTTGATWTIVAGNVGVAPVPSILMYTDPNVVIRVGDPVETTDPVTGDKITTTTTTITNILTGLNTVETEVVREKIQYTSQALERYDTLNLPIGNIYRFQFVKDFQDYGYIPDVDDPDYSVTRGIYRLDRILSYKDIITSGIDIYNNLYVPLGLSKAMYEHDEKKFNSTVFYKLTDPTNTKVTLYMPYAFMIGTPDGSIAEYSTAALVIDLGIYNDVEMLDDMLSIVSAMLLARWGIEPIEGSTTPPVQMINTGSVWLTTKDYKTLEDYRKQVIANTSSTTLLDKLFSSEMNKLYSENSRLRTQVANYEEIIQQQG